MEKVLPFTRNRRIPDRGEVNRLPSSISFLARVALLIRLASIPKGTPVLVHWKIDTPEGNQSGTYEGRKAHVNLNPDTLRLTKGLGNAHFPLESIRKLQQIPKGKIPLKAGFFLSAE